MLADDTEWSAATIFYEISLLLLSVIVLFQSVMTIMAICGDYHMRRTPSTIFIVNLAVVDICLASCVILVFLVHPILSVIGGHSTLPFAALGVLPAVLIASVLFTFANSLDRYIFFKMSIKYHALVTLARVRRTVAIMWAIVIVMLVISLIITSHAWSNNEVTIDLASPPIRYGIRLVHTVCFFIFVVVTFVMYISVLKEVNKSNKKHENFAPSLLGRLRSFGGKYRSDDTHQRQINRFTSSSTTSTRIDISTHDTLEPGFSAHESRRESQSFTLSIEEEDEVGESQGENAEVTNSEKRKTSDGSLSFSSRGSIDSAKGLTSQRNIDEQRRVNMGEISLGISDMKDLRLSSLPEIVGKKPDTTDNYGFQSQQSAYISKMDDRKDQQKGFSQVRSTGPNKNIRQTRSNVDDHEQKSQSEQSQGETFSSIIFKEEATTLIYKETSNSPTKNFIRSASCPSVIAYQRQERYGSDFLPKTALAMTPPDWATAFPVGLGVPLYRINSISQSVQQPYLQKERSIKTDKCHKPFDCQELRLKPTNNRQKRTAKLLFILLCLYTLLWCPVYVLNFLSTFIDISPDVFVVAYGIGLFNSVLNFSVYPMRIPRLKTVFKETWKTSCSCLYEP